MKPAEIKRYRLCGEEYKDAFMATNNDWSVPSDEHDYVLAADHDRVVADLLDRLNHPDYQECCAVRKEAEAQVAALTERLRVARDLLLNVSDELNTCDCVLNTTWVNIDAWLQRENGKAL